MSNSIQVTVEIICHATEDIDKFYDSFYEFFDIKPEKFSAQNLTGHFENPITMLQTKISKKEALNFIQRLITKMTRTQIDELIDELNNRVKNSTLYLRFDKQELMQGKLSLNEKNAIKVKIYTPIYRKKDTLKSYTALLRQIPSTT